MIESTNKISNFDFELFQVSKSVYQGTNFIKLFSVIFYLYIPFCTRVPNARSQQGRYKKYIFWVFCTRDPNTQRRMAILSFILCEYLLHKRPKCPEPSGYYFIFCEYSTRVPNPQEFLFKFFLIFLFPGEPKMRLPTRNCLEVLFPFWYQ